MGKDKLVSFNLTHLYDTQLEIPNRQLDMWVRSSRDAWAKHGFGNYYVMVIEAEGLNDTLW